MNIIMRRIFSLSAPDILSFGLFGMVFPIGKIKGYQCENNRSDYHDIKSFHYLLLLRWYREKSDDINNYCAGDAKRGDRIVEPLTDKAADKTRGKKILDDIHEHFAGFLPSFAVFHKFNLPQRPLFGKFNNKNNMAGVRE